MIEPGRHKARAISAELGYTSTGKEQVAVAFEVDGGQRITWFGYFTDKTADKTLDGLMAAGWQGDDLRDLSTVGSQDCEIVVEHENDNDGQPRARVRWVNRLGNGVVTLKQPMSDAQRASFAERMRGKVIAKRQAEPARRPSDRGDDLPPEAFDDDDIGF